MNSIVTESAPKAIGPYSQGTTSGKMVFASGQLGIDPQTGSFAGESVEAQAEMALKNLKSVLEAGGATMQDVVKTTVFIADMNDFAAVNQIYATYFVEPYPARACVEVARLPKDGKVEIDAIAVV